MTLKMKKIVSLILYLICAMSAMAQGYFGEEALEMTAKYLCQDLTIHVVSKDTDSIPDLTFYLVHSDTALEPTLDTVTVNTKPRTMPFTLFGSISRKKNDLFFKTIVFGQYELHLFVHHKEFVRRFYLSTKQPLEITIKVDEK